MVLLRQLLHVTEWCFWPKPAECAVADPSSQLWHISGCTAWNAAILAAVISVLHQLPDRINLVAGDWQQQGESAAKAGILDFSRIWAQHPRWQCASCRAGPADVKQGPEVGTAAHLSEAEAAGSLQIPCWGRIWGVVACVCQQQPACTANCRSFSDLTSAQASHWHQHKHNSPSSWFGTIQLPHLEPGVSSLRAPKTQAP